MEFLNVVVALDLSPLSRGALMRARSLVDPEGTLHLVHVVDSVIETSAPRHATPEAMNAYRKQQESEALAALENLARDLRREDPKLIVRVEVRFGRPVDEILGVASGLDADLLAVGAHGKNVFDRLLLGSVAEQVARRSSVPTLVVRESPSAAPPVDRILVAVDLGEPSHEAARVADTVSRRLGKPLEALHVIDARGLPLQAAGVFDPVLLDQETRDALEHAPEAIARVLSDAAVVPPPIRVLVGFPGEEIVHAARPADVIVCGTHGRGLLGRLAFGSVALHLLRHAPCPLIVVRPKPRQAS